jgi:putative heme-binding domain-containing protein
LFLLWIGLLFFQQRALLNLPQVDKNPFTSAADVERGKQLYNGRCAGCHGPTGDGGKGTNLATPALPRAQTDLALYRIIRYGLPDTEMPGHNLTQREIWQISAFVRQLGRAGSGGLTGDPRRGEALVTQKGGCIACHVVNGKGGLAGPALTDIGNRRSPSYLRAKLVDPGRELATGFSVVRLLTRDGKRLTGTRLNEDTWSIQIRDDSGGLHSFWKEELAELTIEQRTTMPSYAKLLSESEINDIVAYLSATGGMK